MVRFNPTPRVTSFQQHPIFRFPQNPVFHTPKMFVPRVCFRFNPRAIAVEMIRLAVAGVSYIQDNAIVGAQSHVCKV
jgi:hypothetical protein